MSNFQIIAEPPALNYSSKYGNIREILNKALSITGFQGGGGVGVEDFSPPYVLHKKLIDVGHFSCKERFFGGGLH